MSKDDGISDGFASAIIIFACGGIGVLVWQVLQFMKFGIWNPVSVISALELMKVQWAFEPNDWMGIHEIFKFMPLSLSMMMPVLLALVIDN